jgi:hypothetical protein
LTERKRFFLKKEPKLLLLQMNAKLAPTLRSESFLVLFFKKERLSFPFGSPRRRINLASKPTGR